MPPSGLTTVLPGSWPSKSRNIGQYNTPPAGFETIAASIQMNEYSPDISTKDARLSLNVTDAASMDFFTAATTFTDTVKKQVFMACIRGGYTILGGTDVNKRYPPMVHPYFTGMFATGIEAVKDMSPSEAAADGIIVPYNITKFTINFESLQIIPGTATVSEGQFNQNWMMYASKDTNQRVSVSLGYYQFTDFPYTGQPALLGNWKVQPLTYITLKFYQVLQSNIYTSASSFKTIWSPFVGYCNAALIPGTDWETESLMLQGGEVELYWNWQNVPLANVTLEFIYSAWGWNKSLTFDGNIRHYAGPVTGALAFPTTNFMTIFNAINPPNA